MFNKTTSAYLSLAIPLIFLGFAYLFFPPYRLISAVAIGLTYFLWGIIIHLKDKTLHLTVILEYLGISLLGTIILIFISLRA